MSLFVVKRVARRVEPRAQLLEVVDLAVLHHPDGAVLVADRLVAAGDVDDAEAAVAEHRARLVRRRQARNRHHAFVIGTAMAHRGAHRAHERLGRVRAVEINEAGNTAHYGHSWPPSLASELRRVRRSPVGREPTASGSDRDHAKNPYDNTVFCIHTIQRAIHLRTGTLVGDGVTMALLSSCASSASTRCGSRCAAVAATGRETETSASRRGHPIAPTRARRWPT